MNAITSTITPSDSQWQAIKKAAAWFRAYSEAEDKSTVPQVFHIFGYAGVGKTEIAKFVVQEMNLTSVIGACPTGKASHMMRVRGFPNSQTIHSLIYTPIDKGRGIIPQLQEQLRQLEAEQADQKLIDSIQAKIKRELSGLQSPAWMLKTDSDLRYADLLVIDECFVAGTKTDTPNGRKSIEKIVPGEQIYNACGIDTVIAISKKKAVRCAQIVVGSKTITSSTNHRFFTHRGVVRASDLRPGDRLTSLSESMRLLQEAVYAAKRESVGETILQRELLNALVATVPRVQSKNLHGRACSQGWRGQKKIPSFWFSRSFSSDRTDQESKAIFKSRSQKKDQRDSQTNWAQAKNSGWKWSWPITYAASFVQQAVRFLGNGVYNLNWATVGGVSSLLQDRYSGANQEDCNRSGWWFSRLFESSSRRQEEDRISSGEWVDSIEILESTDSRLDQYRDANGELYLYDLQAAQHSSFSVEGILVHNCSMVGAEIGSDILSFGKPVLVLGDPGQLPPVGDGGFFTEVDEPEVMLTEVQRNAKDSAIIRMATMARMDGWIPVGKYSDPSGVDSIVAHQGDYKRIMAADQLLCGHNMTRHRTNRFMREKLGFKGEIPMKGERLVCLRNRAEYNLMNGALYKTLEDAVDISEKQYLVKIQSEDFPEFGEVEVTGHKILLGGDPKELLPWAWNEAQAFDYGYALTVHKYQGSQAPRIVLNAEWSRKDTWKQWLYTGVTRAQISTYIVVP